MKKKKKKKKIVHSKSKKELETIVQDVKKWISAKEKADALYKEMVYWIFDE